MSYAESKKKLDTIHREYSCKGDVIFRTSIQYIVEHGQCNFRNKKWFDSCIENVDKKHDLADRDGKHMFIGREFEKALLECAKELAEIESYDLLTYIQREVWLSNSNNGEPDYQRALQIIRNCLCDADYYFGSYGSDSMATLQKLRDIGLTDDEIVYFGWEHLLDAENEED